MTINLEEWAKDAKEVIADAKKYSNNSVWQIMNLTLMTNLIENETVVQGSKYQSLFGSLRHTYEQATGEKIYQEILA